MKMIYSETVWCERGDDTTENCEIIRQTVKYWINKYDKRYKGTNLVI